MKGIYNHNCRKCELWKRKRTVCVEGRGDWNAEILFVAQAPGEIEDETGQTLVGPSGTMLCDYGLPDAGVDRYRLANVVKCMPPSNRKPTAKEVKACSEYLVAEINRMPNLKIVVALGDVAAKFFGVKSKITKIAGTPYPGNVGDKKFIVYPVIHPAYVLRKAEYADKFQQLLNGIPSLLTGVDTSFVRLVEGETSVSVIKRFTNIKYKTPIAFDLETTGLDPTRNSILSVSFCTNQKGARPVSCLLDTPEAIDALSKFYQSDRPKIVHHVGFEYVWGKYFLGAELNNVVGDTRILSFREDSNRPTNLHVLSATHAPELAGFKIDSMSSLEEGEHWWSMDKKTRGIRNALDALATMRAYQKLVKILGEEVIKVHREYDIPVAITYARMRRNGIAVDMQRLINMEEASKVRQANASRRAARAGIDVKNLGSNQQVSAAFKKLGLDTGVRGKDPKVMSIAKDPLLNLKEKFPHTSKWVDPILSYKEEVKFRGTYIKGLAETVHKIQNGIGFTHGGFNWPGTVTWRPTGHKSKQPPFEEINPLNLPRGEYRNVFVSRFPNGKIVKGDFSQAELVTLAALSEDGVMRDIYERGLDIHKNTQEALGLSSRTVAKNINFGVIYGIMEQTFKATLRRGGIIVTLEQARRWIEAWKREYPRAWGYMERLQKLAVKNRKIAAPAYGVYRIFPSREKEWQDVAREGANFPIQFLASAITNRGANIFEGVLDEKDGLLVNCVYDELVADVREGKEAAVARLMKDSMIAAAKEQEWLDLPMGADIAIGDSWGEAVEVNV